MRVSQRRSRRDTGGREFAADRALRALASGSVTTEGVDERVGRYRKPAVTAFGNSQTGTKMDTGRLWCDVDSAAHVIELLSPSARCYRGSWQRGSALCRRRGPALAHCHCDALASETETVWRASAAEGATRAPEPVTAVTEDVDERVCRCRCSRRPVLREWYTLTPAAFWCNVVVGPLRVGTAAAARARCHGVAGSAARPSVAAAGPRWRSVIVTRLRPRRKQFGARLLPRARRARPSPSRL
jgi:hypothetical protein